MTAKHKTAGRTKPRKRVRAIISAHPARVGAGRRSDLTDSKARTILKVLVEGAYFKVACGIAGIAESTAYAWLDRGGKELSRILALEKTGENAPEPLPTELPFLEFLESVQHAEAESEMRALKTVRSFFRKDWRCALAFLERRHRDRWGQRMELVGDPDLPLMSHVVVFVPDNGRGPPKEPGKK